MQFDEGRHTKKTDLEKKSAFWRVNGGARTHDNQNHNLALYQLNYAHHVQDCKGNDIFLICKGLVLFFANNPKNRKREVQNLN